MIPLRSDENEVNEKSTIVILNTNLESLHVNDRACKHSDAQQVFYALLPDLLLQNNPYSLQPVYFSHKKLF